MSEQISLETSHREFTLQLIQEQMTLLGESNKLLLKRIETSASDTPEILKEIKGNIEMMFKAYSIGIPTEV